MRMCGRVIVPATVLAVMFSMVVIHGWAGEARSSDNARAAELYRQDQAERHALTADGLHSLPAEQAAQLRVNDADRREEMLEILRAGDLRTSRDFLHAAMIFQHGSDAGDYRLAHGLAVVSAAADPDHRLARWMVAASWDRYMRYRGRPQWYGTQYTLSKDGRRLLAPVDESAVSDEERRLHGIRPLQELRGPQEAEGARADET